MATSVSASGEGPRRPAMAVLAGAARAWAVGSPRGPGSGWGPAGVPPHTAKGRACPAHGALFGDRRAHWCGELESDFARPRAWGITLDLEAACGVRFLGADHSHQAHAVVHPCRAGGRSVRCPR